MLGIVLVSHSKKLSEGVAELVGMLAKDVPVAAAGGLDDGSFGTSFYKITAALGKVIDADGVIVLCDMGSAIMTTEMALEALNDPKIRMVNAPLVEGALVVAMASMTGQSLEEALKQLAQPNVFDKGIAS